MLEVLMPGACGGMSSKFVPYLLTNGLRIIALDNFSSCAWDNFSSNLRTSKFVVDINRSEELEQIWSKYESLTTSYFQLKDEVVAAETNKQSIGSPVAIQSQIATLNVDTEQEIAEIVLRIKKRLESI
jgi:UDP-glucose 4-epimerase